MYNTKNISHELSPFNNATKFKKINLFCTDILNLFPAVTNLHLFKELNE